MNREIKFRAWIGDRMEYNVTAGKFGSFYVNPMEKGDGLDPHDSACLSPFNTIYDPQTPIMEYTGLKGKGNVEIYEGDIVKTDPENIAALIGNAPQYTHGVIKMLNGSWCVCQRGIGATPMREFSYCGCCPCGLIVIGDMYKNKDLLGK